MRRTGWKGPEITAQGSDAAARSGCCEYDDGERVGGELREVDVVGVGDDVAGEIALMEPASEGESAALRTAELHDLCEDDGA
jgi:hypothetical protein